MSSGLAAAADVLADGVVRPRLNFRANASLTMTTFGAS